MLQERFTRRQFSGLSLLAMLTGSAVFGSKTDPPNDKDYLCLATNEEVSELRGVGWELSGSGADDEDYEPDVDEGFVSLKQGDTNLIVTACPKFAGKWIAAHDHCVREQQPDKPSRIKVFRHYLYGESLSGDASPVAKELSLSTPTP